MAVPDRDARYLRFQVIRRVDDNIDTHFRHHRRRQAARSILGTTPVRVTLPTGTTHTPGPIEIQTAHTTSTVLSATHAQSNQSMSTSTTMTNMGDSTTSAGMGTKDTTSMQSTSTTRSVTPTQDRQETHSSLTSTSTRPPSVELEIIASTTTVRPTFSITTQVIVQTSSIITRDQKKNTSLIAESVIGAIGFLSILILAAIVCFRFRRYRAGRSSKRQSLATSDESVAPFTTPSRGQGYSANKLQAEREWMRGYIPADVDHQEVTDRDSDQPVEDSQQESISAGDSTGNVPFNPPPLYTP